MRRKKSEAQRIEEQRHRLAMHSSTKAAITPVDGISASVHTASRFHDPRTTVSRAIRESMDPVRAPRTLYIWTADDGAATEAAQAHRAPRAPLGPQTAQAIAEIDARHARMRMLRRASKAAKERRDNPMGYASRGLTSGFADAEKETRTERDRRIEKFLRAWLRNGPQIIANIRKDALREELPWSAVRRVSQSMGVIVQRLGVPHGRPTTVWTLPEGLS